MLLLASTKTASHQSKTKPNKKPKGYELDRPALAAVFARFDPLRRGALGLAEFLAMTLFLRSATATFNAFDKDRKGVIALTFPQFLFASAHCV
jgi:hypothetical protein